MRIVLLCSAQNDSFARICVKGNFVNELLKVVSRYMLYITGTFLATFVTYYISCLNSVGPSHYRVLVWSNLRCTVTQDTSL